LFVQKRIYLKAKDGSIPEDAEACGWIVSTNAEGPYQDAHAADGAKQLGWVDDTWLYLLPEDTYKTVFSHVQQAGELLVSQRTLYKALAERQLTMVKPPHLTYPEWLDHKIGKTGKAKENDLQNHQVVPCTSLVSAGKERLKTGKDLPVSYQ
jgi:hypothetical protein